MKKEIIKKLQELEKYISKSIKEIQKAVIELEDEPIEPKIYTKDELRKLKEVVHTKYVTKDAVWAPDFKDKTSIDNEGTVLVTASKTRLKRQYAGAVQSDWFKGFKNNYIDLFNYLFALDEDVDINDGLYEVDVVHGIDENFILSGKNKKVSFAEGALIKVKPNSFGGNKEKVSVLNFGYGSENVTIEGLKIQGETHEHIDTPENKGGEFFIGLNITDAKNSEIKNLKITEMWGDGVCFSNDLSSGWGKAKRAENITIDNFIIDDCGRNGITFLAGINCIIKNGEISNVNRANPKGGVDCEQGEGSQLYSPWGNLGIDNIIFRNLEIHGNSNGIILFHHTGKVLIDNCNIHSNSSFGITVRRNHGNQVIRNTTFDGLLTHKLTEKSKLVVDKCNVTWGSSSQDNLGGTVEVINKSKFEYLMIKRWNGGEMKIKDSEIRLLRISEIYEGSVDVEKTKIDARSYRGFYALQFEGEIDKVKVEDCEITGANKYGHSYGLIVDKSTKIDKPEDIQIINNKFYNNSRTAKIEVPITFEGNTDEQGEIIKL